MPMATVNGAELYHEVRGDGPPVLLVTGATGDGGHFDALANLLADEFTVISYDRRGNGRSPRPAGWVTTSPKEQADDAAALLAALGVGPAAAFGTSSGANFTLALVIHHPSAVRGAILHEPVMTSLTDDPAALRGAAATLLKEGIEAGGPPAALERCWRLVAGETSWDDLDARLRERMLASADTFLETEVGTFEAFLPDDATLGAIPAPVQSAHQRQRTPPLTPGGRPAGSGSTPRSRARQAPTPHTTTTRTSWRRPSGRSFAKSARSACRSCSAQKAGRGGACFASASGSQCRRRSRARSGRVPVVSSGPV